MKLKKAANILFLVGAIVSIVLAVLCVVSSIVCLVLGGNPEFRDLLLESMRQHAQGVTDEEIVLIVNTICAYFIVCGVLALIVGLCGIPSAIFAFKARNNNSKAVFILNIIFGILSCATVNVVGAVFALIKGDTIVTEEPAPVEQKAE